MTTWGRARSKNARAAAWSVRSTSAMSRQDELVVAVARQGAGDGAADEPAVAGDEDAGVCVDDAVLASTWP